MALDTEKLYRTYYLKVYSYVRNMVGNPSVAEEIAQDTFVRAYTAKDGWRGGASEFTWLCAIAKNLCYDYFRAERKKAVWEEDEESASGGKSPEEDFLAEETSFTIHKILHGLEEPYKEVFELRVFGELSFLQIAGIFGKTESWARVTYHRGRLKMKERIGNV